MSITLKVGDCREVLKTLEPESVQCCVTSPPYFGLRDYGHAGQIGLEPTPDAYVAELVAVFREVWRVLKDDGTLWLNLGDSYNAGRNGGHAGGAKQASLARHAGIERSGANVPGLKPKDLIGIPWRVAFALQAPQYNGAIAREADRMWLAAMLDAEGCMFIHKRKAGQSNGQGYERQSDTYSPGVEISNTHRTVVERIAALVGKGSVCEQECGRFGRKQTLYRWNLRTTESREFVRELYPYLVAKQHQARVICGCPSSGPKAEAAHAALKLLHRGGETTVDFPAPASMFGPGWYLRSDIIWSKLNPMPESVADRPTKAHEYLFLLSKSERYYYDAESIAEPAESAGEYNKGVPQQAEGMGIKATGNAIRGALYIQSATRNRRTVWTVATQPYSGAHFATFPPALIEPCILAGSRVGDTILDPFGGAGTTGLVADRLSRHALLIELNPEYATLARHRIHDDNPLFAEVSP